MLNALSILFGLLALPIVLLGYIPLLGWLNWLAIPLTVIGIALGALSKGTFGRNFNIVMLVASGVRLWLGGGLL